MSLRLLHQPRRDPMRIAVFSSCGPGNFKAALDTAAQNDAMKVVLLVSDRRETPAANLARERDIPVIERDFASRLSQLPPELRAGESESMHDELLQAIEDFEVNHGRIDLCVLAYHRIIRGALLERYRDRIINQHPADLTCLDELGRRRYTGMGGFARSIDDGNAATRTSTILVNDVVDGGEILGQGPWVPVDRTNGEVDLYAHEQRQKRCSDWPILAAVLNLIAGGRLAIDSERYSRCVYVDGQPLAYGGVQL